MLATRDWRKSTFATPKGRRVWKPVFIAALREHGVVSYSARIANIDRSAAYVARKKDAAFAEAWDEALEEGVEELERAAIARAKKKSDTLLIFLLKCRKPGVYGDKQRIELAGSDKSLTIRVEYSDDYTPPAASGAEGGYRQRRTKQRISEREKVGEDSSSS